MPPRGGRGGGARRGGATKPGFTRIGGMEIAYDPDIVPERDGRPQPSKTFPDYPGGGHPPAPRPPSSIEKRQVQLQRRIRSLIRRSPLYTTFSSDSAPGSTTMYSSRFGPGAVTPRIVGQSHGVGASNKRPYLSTSNAAAAASSVDPFNVMPHYSDRYDQKRRKIPRLDRQKVPVVLDFFPEELHSTLSPDTVKSSVAAAAAGTASTNGTAINTADGKAGTTSTAASGRKLRKTRASLNTNELEADAAAAAADYFDPDLDADADDGKPNRTKKAKKKKRKVVAEEGEDIEDIENENEPDDDEVQKEGEEKGAAGRDEDEDGAIGDDDVDDVDDDDDDDDEEDPDDAFEDDEEGDYNAEGYFDDGGDDAGDDDVGDGDGGDYD